MISRRAFVATVAATGCARRGAITRIVVGGQSDLVYLPTTLAQQLGVFRAQGLEVAIEDVGAGSKALQAVIGGSADVATGFFDHAIQMAAEGRPVKAFVTLTRYPGAVLAVSPQAVNRIHRIEDLKGAMVGVTAPGSSSHFFANYLLVRHGLSPSDIRVFAMGPGPARVVAIASGRVDAGVLFEPSLSVLLKRAPQVRLLADTRTPAGVKEVFGTDEYPSAVLYGTGDWLRENRDKAHRLATAMRETLRWIQEHTAAQIAAKMPASIAAEDPSLYVQAVEHSKQLYSVDGVMRPEAAAAVRRVLAISIEKVRQANIDVAQAYTNEF